MRGIIQPLLENRSLLYLLILAVVFILSTLYKGKKVKLKKRSLKSNILLEKIIRQVDKISFLKNYRDSLAIDLALITRKNTQTNLYIANYLISSLILMFIILLVLSIIVFKYWLLKFLVPLSATFLISIIFLKVINSKRKKAKRDFGEVVSIFTTQYAKCFNVYAALQESIKYIPYTHKYEFARLIVAMGSSDNYDKALDEYAKRIDDPMCTTFTRILKLNYKRNDNILIALIDLQNYIAQEKKTEMQRINTLQDKKLNIYFSIGCILGAILVVIYFLGNFALDFYFSSFLGQTLVLIGFILSGISVITIQIIEKI